jgi:hypothetical protein
MVVYPKNFRDVSLSRKPFLFAKLPVLFQQDLDLALGLITLTHWVKYGI